MGGCSVPPHPIIWTLDIVMGCLNCVETCGFFSGYICSNVSEEMNSLLVALFPLY